MIRKKILDQSITGSDEFAKKKSLSFLLLLFQHYAHEGKESSVTVGILMV